MVKGNSYPTSEVQRITPTLLTEQAKPPVKRTASEIADERWGLRKAEKEKPPPLASLRGASD
jgi:hypothetical protein